MRWITMRTLLMLFAVGFAVLAVRAAVIQAQYPCLLQQLKMLTSSSSIKDADCDLVVGLCAASVIAW